MKKRPSSIPILNIGFIQCRIELKKIFRANAKVTVNIFKSACNLRRLFLLTLKKNFFPSFFLLFSEKKIKVIQYVENSGFESFCLKN